MSEFPASEADELITKQFLRAKLAELSGGLRSEMAELRRDMAGLETKLTMRIGTALVAQTTVIVGLLSLIG